MAGMNPGFAAYLAAKKSGKQAVPQNNKAALPPAVFNNVPGLPSIGKRHAKVKSAKKPHKGL